jgi:hypothetical protein
MQLFSLETGLIKARVNQINSLSIFQRIWISEEQTLSWLFRTLKIALILISDSWVKDRPIDWKCQEFVFKIRQFFVVV